MPWIDKERCTGCGICVQDCPVDAIALTDSAAAIDMDECIRCGSCHNICAQEAVRHDSEKIPPKVESNLNTARRLLKKCKSRDDKINYLTKYIKSFRLNIKIAQKSID
ncbi:MAG: 4Fe-4S binding protein, partial [Elusimicrobiota bacterium]|nr:4Fe-4S binding protein [Elusimicrobiota bacterium]